MPNVSTIRSFRVLRPLRSVSKLPGLQKIMGGLVDSLGHLSNVMLLLMFLVICFSITGVLFWNGILHARCRLTPYPVRMANGCRDVLDPCWKMYLENVKNYLYVWKIRSTRSYFYLLIVPVVERPLCHLKINRD